MVIGDGHIRYSLCGFRCYKRGVNLFKSLSAVLVHRDLFSHKNRPHSFCKICKLGMRSDFFKNKAKTLENTRFSRVWSCWADLKCRKLVLNYPFLSRNLLFSRLFGNYKCYVVPFNPDEHQSLKAKNKAKFLLATQDVPVHLLKH